MKAIYFPFTVVSQQMTDALSACFKPVAVYQPSANFPKAMREWSEKGLLELRCPVRGDEDKLESLMKEYRKWAELHQGTESGFFTFRPGDDEDSAARIRSALRSGGIPQTAEKPDFLFNARLFLMIAQEFDLEHQEVDKELSAFEKMEKKLFAELRGEDEAEISLGKRLVRDEPGNHMPSERLSAWTRLMLEDTEFSEFFITGSREVFDILADKTPNLEPYSSEDLSCGKLNVFIVRGESPRHFFTRCAESDMSGKHSLTVYHDTLIGLMNI